MGKLAHLKASLQRFIRICNECDITPAEKDIDSFLTPSTKHYTTFFIFFCFYYWEKRNDQYIINIAIADMKLNNKLPKIYSKKKGQVN